MTSSPIPPWVCAVLLHARDMKSLVAFYREMLAIPFHEEGGGAHLHYGCELGDVHFAIHPAGKSEKTEEGGYRVAFAVAEVDAVVARLKKRGSPIVMEPMDLDFGRLAMFRDPEGNVVEIVTLSKSWLDHLDTIRKK